MPRHEVSPDEAATVTELGRTIRRVRTRLGLTVDELAEESSLSVGLISQLERGLGNPSYATLRRLAAALGMDLSSMIGSASDENRVVRPRDRRRLPEVVGAPGLLREVLTPGQHLPMQVIRTVLPAGTSNESRPFRHLGTETVHVVEGRVAVVLGGRRHELEAGDTITYDCAEAHWWTNEGAGDAVVFGVTVPFSR